MVKSEYEKGQIIKREEEWAWDRILGPIAFKFTTEEDTWVKGIQCGWLQEPDLACLQINSLGWLRAGVPNL